MEHPHKIFFLALGSPFNFLSRNDDGSFKSENNFVHYSNNQIAFANMAMATLIDLILMAKDIGTVEDIYKKIADQRLEIFKDTRESEFEKYVVNNVAPLFLDSEIDDSYIQEVATVIKYLSYRDSHSQVATVTVFNNSEDCQYRKYCARKGVPLNLATVVRLLGIEEREDDNKIILGDLQQYENDSVTHVMGIYRSISDDDGEDKNSKKIARINRVDEVTEIAWNKALEAEDRAQVLHYAFIFGALRGYNVRSVSGACFAQEMSLRLVLGLKNLPQPCKEKGVFLDVEAVSAEIFSESDEEHFANFIAKQVQDYEAALLSQDLAPNSFFTVPHKLQNPDAEFTRYLLDTKQYRVEDLLEIAHYTCGDETALHIAARAGDKELFEMIEKEITFNSELRQSLQDIDWQSVKWESQKFHDEELTTMIEQCAENVGVKLINIFEEFEKSENNENSEGILIRDFEVVLKTLQNLRK